STPLKMTDGPYRDLGSGFARLTGAEAPRRAPSPISHVEDALAELLRNSRDAGAKNVYVASTLRNRRHRVLTVIDDGSGVPEAYAQAIFDPGVTTRHLDPVRDRDSPHGAGLSLHHIKNAALEAKLVHAASPTSIRCVFDTHALPERSLQSESRSSQTNLLATTKTFARENPPLALHCASPSIILATLIDNRIIQTTKPEGIRAGAKRIGIEVSSRTARRISRGEVSASGGVSDKVGRSRGARGRGRVLDGPLLALGEKERADIASALRRVARAGYLDIGETKYEVRPGEVEIKVQIREPEDEYE
ncbi:MAG: ATP-binding protein, partial [Rubrobacteraceae bacterium]